MDRSIYAAYNARSLTISEMCSSFVENEAYFKLGANSHSILVGPRGSGKTTLMRMLQVEALGNRYKSSVSSNGGMDYTGVFIPTDRLWKQQYESLSSITDDEHRLLACSLAGMLFTYHVIGCICDSLRYRFSKSSVYKSLSSESIDEAGLVGELSGIWYLTPEIPSVRSLSLAVVREKSKIAKQLSKIISEGDIPVDVAPTESLCDVVKVINESVSVINICVEEEQGKWVFLFDELELAPDDILKPLYQAMRGGPDHVFFKLSLSPYNQNLCIDYDATRPMPNHDYDVIRIPEVSDDSREFAKSLMSHVFSLNGHRNNIETYFEKPKEMNVEEVFRSLVKVDDGFLQYLKKHDIDLESLSSYSDGAGDKGPTVRKIKFVAQVRSYFRSVGGRASRKGVANFYLGFENICKSVEYNPRMIIALANNLVYILNQKGAVSLSDQGEALRKVYESQAALYSSIALCRPKIDFQTIYEFVDYIGGFFSEQIVGDKFNAEPLLTFQVDDPACVEVVGAALNVGALVHMPSEDKHDFGVDSPENTRCRLSFLLAHKYKLLLTGQGVCQLSRVLNGKRGNKGYNEVQLRLL